jgi:hypothetical protein
MSNILALKKMAALIICVATITFAPSPAAAQDDGLETDETTTVGTVAISTPTTLVVRRENGRYQVFVFERDATRPQTAAVGSRVRVVSTPGSERGVRVASRVTVTGSPAAGAQAQGDEDVVPSSVRDLERSVRRQVRRFNVGARTGVALDPELVLVGVHAQFATGFNRNVIFRPNVEFAWGELTTMFALNLEGVYRFGRQGRWTPYVGGGPGFNFTHAGLRREDRNVDFDDYDFDTCLNILGGLENRNGLFLELKTSVYANPAPSLRVIVGYNF